MERETEYRLVVGEIGNEVGHLIPCRAQTLRGARQSLARALAPYGGDGWGGIEVRYPDYDWMPVGDDCPN